MSDFEPDFSGKWRTHRGSFSQTISVNGRAVGKLTATQGQPHDGISRLQSLYDYQLILAKEGSAAGLEHLWNLTNIAYSIEFYLFDDPAEVGPAAQALAIGNKKSAKAARKNATISLRAKWHSSTGEYYRYDYETNRTRGRDYAGWVELYDPERFTVRKIDINETWEYTEAINKRVRAAYQSWVDAEQRKPQDQRHGFLPYATYLAKVMYSAHQLKESRLSLETLTAVHCRIDDFAKATEALRELPKGTQDEDFDWRRIELLYA